MFTFYHSFIDFLRLEKNLFYGNLHRRAIILFFSFWLLVKDEEQKN